MGPSAPRVVGEGDALDLSLSGRTVDAETALRMGLVSRVVDDPRAVATEVARNPPDALRALKRRLRDRGPVADREAAEATAFGECLARHAADVASERTGGESNGGEGDEDGRGNEDSEGDEDAGRGP